MKQEKRTVRAQWIDFINLQPESERLYLYEGMLDYLFYEKKESEPTKSLSYLYKIMKPAMSHITSGMKGGRPRIKD